MIIMFSFFKKNLFTLKGNELAIFVFSNSVHQICFKSFLAHEIQILVIIHVKTKHLNKQKIDPL